MNSGWTRYTLEDVIEVVSGLVDPNVSPYLELPHVGGDNIESHTGKLRNLRTSKDLGLISGKYSFGKEHVLYSKIRPNLNKVVVSEFEGICSADIYPLKPKNGLISREFLAHVLRSDEFVRYAISHSTRTNIPKVNRKALLGYSLGLPVLDEQMRIATILDKADSIRRKLQQSLRLSDDFLRSVFLEMFGDPVTNPKGWGITNMGEKLEFLTSGSRGWAQYYAEEGDFFVRIQNLRSGVLDVSDAAFVNPPHSAEAKRTQVRPGDVLLSITADLGRTAVVPDGFGIGYISQHLAILRLLQMNPVFVSHFLASSGGQRQFAALNRSAVKAGLNFDDIRSIKLLCPPLAVQEKFAAIVAKLQGHLRNRLHPQFAESQKLFSSLQQRAFRGEL